MCTLFMESGSNSIAPSVSQRALPVSSGGKAARRGPGYRGTSMSHSLYKSLSGPDSAPVTSLWTVTSIIDTIWARNLSLSVPPA